MLLMLFMLLFMLLWPCLMLLITILFDQNYKTISEKARTGKEKLFFENSQISTWNFWLGPFLLGLLFHNPSKCLYYFIHAVTAIISLKSRNYWKTTQATEQTSFEEFNKFCTITEEQWGPPLIAMIKEGSKEKYKKTIRIWRYLDTGKHPNLKLRCSTRKGFITRL